MPDVDEERRELDDIRERATSGFHLGLEGAVSRASLGREVSWVPGLPLVIVVHLTGDEQNGLRSRDLDGLGVSGWVEHAFGCKPLDLRCHASSPLWIGRRCQQPAVAGHAMAHAR